VYKYPQNTSRKPDIIIQITINKFIANENEVVLDATCSTDDKNRLFSIKVPLDSTKDVIVGMNKAFNTLEKELIDDLIISNKRD
jgi:hypothetical protein